MGVPAVSRLRDHHRPHCPPLDGMVGAGQDHIKEDEQGDVRCLDNFFNGYSVEPRSAPRSAGLRRAQLLNRHGEVTPQVSRR
jgi:hypothetical protein